MSRHSSFHSSKFRHVVGRPASREQCYDDVPITRSVHDNHNCSANPCFIAVVTECVGGGSFLVLPIHHTGRVDHQYPRVCGHRGRVLDIKWNPFDDHCIASCSEDCTVKIWDIPVSGLQENLTKARKTLIGHARRVGLIEWHPTAENLLLSSAYDYNVLLWDVSQVGAVLRCPAQVVLRPVYHRYPSETLLLSVSFNSDGSRLAVTSVDRRVRVLDPRTGKILQVSCNNSHKANKVLYIEGLKMLLSTGSSAWNHRQIVLWDPDDLSEPLHEEDLDGSAGVLFPFYDADTHMLYLAGKGDGNIRYFELSAEKPYVNFLTEYRSLLPQKGLGVMPKRGLDIGTCEIFRFYRLIAIKDLVEPLSMVVPRKQEDLYPMTPGNQAAITAQEWLSGINKREWWVKTRHEEIFVANDFMSTLEPVLMSLKPGLQVANPYQESHFGRGTAGSLSSLKSNTGPARASSLRANLIEEAFVQEQLSYQDAKYPRQLSDLAGWQPDETQLVLSQMPHEPSESPPSITKGEAREETASSPKPKLLQVFHQQQEEIRTLREQLQHKEATIRQLEREIQNTKNNQRAAF